MAFFFKTCFDNSTVVKDSVFEKDYYPKVSLLSGEATQLIVKKESTVIPNKFRAHGNFNREGYVKNYDDIAQ